MIRISALNNLKQILLLISILYFYGLAFALNYKRDTYGMDNPAAFAVMGGIFLIALFIEAGLVWWHRRKRIVWALFFIVSYGLIGLLIAPILYGDRVRVWALVAPLVLVFVLGFAYVYSHLIYEAFHKRMKMTLDDIKAELRSMPGWELLADGLEKTYRFDTFAQALNFVNQCGLVAEKYHHDFDIGLHEHVVKIRISTHEEGGVTPTDMGIAKELDHL